MLNMCYNAVDKHVENHRGNQIALIHDSPLTQSPPRYVSYDELLSSVSKLAGVYADLGVKKGDGIIIYMPMIPEAVMAMLASARIGAVHSLVFGGFAARELATRIGHVCPSLIVTANCGKEPNRIIDYKEITEQAIKLCDQNVSDNLKHVLVYQRPEMTPAPLSSPRDVDWTESVEKAKPHQCVSVEANHPLYVLYSSGTTGIY
jgi:propionyl-CoA synthetase